MNTRTIADQVARIAFEPARLAAKDSYRIELSQDLLDQQDQVIEQLISIAFDTLGLRALDIRIVAPASHHQAAYGNALEQPP